MRALPSLVILALWVQSPPPDPTAVQDGKVYICPMDPDVRSNSPGKCARCGMALVAGLPDPVEYHMDLTVAPRPPKVGETARLTFEVHDPWKDRPVTNFQIVHEKLFHMFVVSQDLQVFLHNHPTLGSDKSFHYQYVFPKSGMYRILGDFYPDGATPQLITKTVIVPGPAPKRASLTRDYSPKDAENMTVELTTDPPQPISGFKTQRSEEHTSELQSPCNLVCRLLLE